MKADVTKRDRRIDRAQNLVILLLTLSALAIFVHLPLFGPLSDQSLIALAQERERSVNAHPDAADTAPALVFPVRMVYTNRFARLGADAITTLSDEFERAGTFLGEAAGSAGDAQPVDEAAFLNALRGEGLYFDFTAALPSEIFSELLGVSVPEPGLSDVRRMLLSLEGADAAVLYVQDGAGHSYRFSTAVSRTALVDFLASRSGESADFAFLLGDDFAQLSPYTLVLGDPVPRSTLNAAPLGGEETLLRRAEFNAHTENRFTEASGTVIVREGSSALYLRPDGTVSYQGGAAEPGSIYHVPAAGADGPTLAEAASAAQRLVSVLLQDLLGDASVYLSGVSARDGGAEITFDLMVDGTPIRFSDGAPAVSVTVEDRSVTAFTCRARSYTRSENAALLLPFAQAAAIARVWDGAELIVAYVDTGAGTVEPVWIAE